MVKKNAIYKCVDCNIVISIIEAHSEDLICCGKPMLILEEHTIEKEGNEKHIPLIHETEKGILIKVGSIPHPMAPDHFIELIQLLKDEDVLYSKMLRSGDEPEADFPVKLSGGLKARAYCNIHGLWKN